MKQPLEKQTTYLSSDNEDTAGLEEEERTSRDTDYSIDTEYLPDSPPPRPVFTPANEENTAKTAQQAHESFVVVGERGHQFRISLAERHVERLTKLGHEPPFLRELNDGYQAKVIAAVIEAFEQPSGKKMICRENFAYSSVAMPQAIPILIKLMDMSLPHIEKTIDYCSLLNDSYEESRAISPQFPDGETRTYFFSEEYLYQGQFVNMEDFLEKHPEQALRIFREVRLGVGFLHDNGIYHRDLKESNVAISGDTPETAQAIIIDFATCTMEKISADYCGTLDYMRPETEEYQYYSPQASDYFALSKMAKNISTFILNLDSPKNRERIAKFNKYASDYKAMSDQQQKRSIQDFIAQQEQGLSLPVNQPHVSAPPSTASQPDVYQTSSNQEIHADLLGQLYQKNRTVIGNIEVSYSDIAYALHQQKHNTSRINQDELLLQQNAYLENFLAFIDVAAHCKAQGFRNDQQMNIYLRTMHQLFSLEEEGLTPMHMVERSRRAIDELTHTTRVLSDKRKPNQALHKAINRLRRITDDPEATRKADLIEEQAKQISIQERVRINRNSPIFRNLLAALESRRGIGCLCSSRQTTSARFFQNALDTQAQENQESQNTRVPRNR